MQYKTLIDVERCTVHPRAFFDPDVYEAEQDRVFGHQWLCIGHESQLPEPGDFLTTTMGEESVLVVRDPKRRIRVFLNSCRHRGTRVCRVDSGRARNFMCPYHGWTYDTEGRLRGVPQLREAYHEELDRDAWSLVEVPRVESFRGLLFANFDAEAVSLDDHLGDMKWYLDLVLHRSRGGTVALPGVHRWRLGGNWKLAAEQFGGDNYHTGALHQSMIKIGLGPSGDYRGDRPWEVDFEAKLEGGHGWINFDVPIGELPPPVEKWMETVRREARETLAPEQQGLVHGIQVGTVFPNLSILAFLGFVTIRVWHPRGPRAIEVWSYGLIERDAPPEVREFARKMQTLTFSSSGIFEQDDGAVWGDVVDSLSGAQRRHYPLNYSMGHGHGRRKPGRPGLLHTLSTEIGVFGFYEYWRRCMAKPT